MKETGGTLLNIVQEVFYFTWCVLILKTGNLIVSCDE